MKAGTIVAVRHQGTVAVAADGLQLDSSGTVIRRNLLRITRVESPAALLGWFGPSSIAASILSIWDHAAPLEVRERAKLVAGRIQNLVGDHRSNARWADAEWLVASHELMAVVDVHGEIVEPDDAVLAVGPEARAVLAATRALLAHTSLDTASIAREAIRLAGESSPLIGDQIFVETLGPESRIR